VEFTFIGNNNIVGKIDAGSKQIIQAEGVGEEKKRETKVGLGSQFTRTIGVRHGVSKGVVTCPQATCPFSGGRLQGIERSAMTGPSDTLGSP
jgi:hypothetical protein